MGFVNLGNILKEDNFRVSQIKSLFQKEEEYNIYFYTIEYEIATYFLKNRNIKEKDIIRILKDIKKNYMQDLDFFQNKLEKEIVRKLSLVLQEKRITHHEFRLVFGYLLWCIDNRSWIPNNRAYLNWLLYFFRLYDKAEMKSYEEIIREYTKILNIPNEQVDAILLKTDKSFLSKEEIEASKAESEEFAKN